ncbi:hypothetical protein V7127_02575 [Bacillus sp. JJ1773]|uniref:hypothetical protein n=1 Tax=Bacillus sp. JJ1773 TaxID=3122965 RepID=UPI002FFE2CFC
MTNKKKIEAKSVAEKTETLIYCGPTIKNGELQQYAVFQGVLPDQVKKHKEANVAVSELFVPVKAFSTFREQIKRKGSRESMFFERALEYAKGGNK